MKKKICYLLIAIMMFTMMPATAMEALATEIMPSTVVDSGKCGDDLTWTLDSEGTLTISGTGKMYDYETWEVDVEYAKNLTPWWKYHTEINQLILQDGITYIGNDAFCHVNNLSGKLELPNSLEKIGDRAFWRCRKLTELKLSESLQNIGTEAFSGCEGFLGNLKLPDSLLSIEDYAFVNCKGFTALELSNSLCEIGTGAFSGCEGFAGDIVVPASVQNIGSEAFYGVNFEHYIIEGDIPNLWDNPFESVKFKTFYLLKDSQVDKVLPAKYNKIYVHEKDMDGHMWTVDNVEENEPTCETEGNIYKYCPLCKETKEEIIEKVPHNYGEWIVEKKVTCETDGNQYRKCVDCGATQNEIIKSKGHEWNQLYTLDKDPTCNETGLKSIHCKNCSAKKDEVVIRKLAHEYGNWIVEKKATCENTGRQYRKCNDCNYIERGIIDLADHQWNSYYTTDKNATCTSVGSKSIHCKVCDERKNIIPIPAKGHRYSSWKTIKKATYYATGTKQRKCSCGKVENTSISRLMLSAPSSVKARLRTSTGGYDDINIYWSKVKSASGYYIYYRNASKTSKWYYLTRTTKTSYTKKNLTDGAKYQFKIVPYYYKSGNRYKSTNYKTASIYTLKKVPISSVKRYSSKKVRVYWKDIAGQSGYQISRSTSKRGTKVIGTYKTSSAKSKVLSATRKKGYYYKVRAYTYTKIGSKTYRVYGPWSTAKYYKLK